MSSSGTSEITVPMMGPKCLRGHLPHVGNGDCRVETALSPCGCPLPAPELCRAHLLHDLEHNRYGDGGRRLLNDLLMPPLDGAVTPEQGHGVPILVGEDLDLQVSGMLGQLHEEDGGARDLTLHLGGQQEGLALPWGTGAGAGSPPKICPRVC